MSNQSNNRGRAYEFICMQSLFEEIGKIRPVEVVQNKPYEAAKREWSRLPEGLQFLLRQSAIAAVETIFDMEPMMLEEGADKLTLADMNEESANMLALQTRQQLAINSLSLASQAAQGILRLF